MPPRSDRVIVSEPVRNLSTSRLAPLAQLAQRGTASGSGEHSERFDEPRLDRLMNRYASRLARSHLLPGAREKLYELRAG